MQIALCQINPLIGNISYNLKKICAAIQKAREERADLVIFSELALLGYPPEDILSFPDLIPALEKALYIIIEASSDLAIVVGTVRQCPIPSEKKLCNTAAVIENKKLLGFQDKALLPEYDVFFERRHFEPHFENKLFTLQGKKIAITLCEDIWQHSEEVEETTYLFDPISELKTLKPDFLINLSASPYFQGRLSTRIEVCQKVAKTLKCPILFCNQVGGQDSLIFDGASFVVDEKKNLVALASSFQEDLLLYPSPSNKEIILPSDLESLYHALVLGLSDYFKKQGFSKALLGLSGGIDSALVACLAVKALGSENVKALFLPSQYSSDESLKDAKEMATRLNIEWEVVSIEKPFTAFQELLHPLFLGEKIDLMEENLQSRIRSTVLMSFSNTFGHLLLSTSNKSEMAMGYTTLYGDMSGALAVIGDLTKKHVYALASWINRHEEIIPQNILKKAPTAELKPNQKDSDSLPPYPILDAIIEDYIENSLSLETIAMNHTIPLPLVKDVVKKIDLSEYKRRQAPLSLRITKKAFSVGRRIPIVHGWDHT